MMEGKKTTITTEPEKEDFFNLNKPVIETEDDFWNVFIDAKNQFSAIKTWSFNLKDAELIQKNKTIEYVPFREHLKRIHVTLPEQFLQNKSVQYIIKVYDELIERIKVVETDAELRQILEEVFETLDRFNLAIDQSNEQKS